MGITTGLFSDILANAPGTADWSKTLPMAGAVDWANVKPFQVINPLTGYNFGATQGTTSSAASPQTTAQEPSEYQKWLAQQSQTSTGGSGSGGGIKETQKTPWGDVLGMPELNGKDFQELSYDQQRQAQAIVDPYGIGNVIKRVVMSSPFATAADRLFSLFGGPVNPTSTPAQLANAYNPAAFGNMSSTPMSMAATAPVGAGIAANPMGLDPAQQAAAGGGGQSYGGFGSAAEQGGAGVAEAHGGFSYGDSSQGNWG